ncbi:TetR/AcrR family transcriptional regulator [Sphaerisporangium corydalis]|uniref:TetR/AcrR family transcriptional regulator n=1 Tax=Sphaerisporangium corydalis TaxID=1441875 RepID=A0ABV9EBW2_9ACTN|nr:TetR/AcrR family transcriptional regulator [Sphaerisporangium corydalis]
MAVTTADPEDLTARARIRDAAMAQFGEHGFERATIRGIAVAAGVSSGLVRHHFGSKQGLLEACDAHLVKTVRRLNSQAAGGAPDLNPLAALGPYQAYLARSLIEGGAAPLFDEMVALGEGWLADADRSRPDPPDVGPRVRSAVIAAMALGIGILRRHVSRGMGADLSGPEGERLLMRALLDIHSHPLLSLEEAAAAREALDRTPSPAGPATPRGPAPTQGGSR